MSDRGRLITMIVTMAALVAVAWLQYTGNETTKDIKRGVVKIEREVIPCLADKRCKRVLKEVIAKKEHKKPSEVQLPAAGPTKTTTTETQTQTTESEAPTPTVPKNSHHHGGGGGVHHAGNGGGGKSPSKGKHTNPSPAPTPVPTPTPAPESGPGRSDEAKEPGPNGKAQGQEDDAVVEVNPDNVGVCIHADGIAKVGC